MTGETRVGDLVVLVDSSDDPIGAVRRGELEQVPDVHFRTAHAFLFDEAGRLLLQQLASSRDRNPLRWGSSVAAYVHPGESYEAAVRRRCREELGVQPTFGFVGKSRMPDLGGIKYIELFKASVLSASVNIEEPNHVAQLEWVSTGVVRDLVIEEPVRFTETFRWLFENFYGDGGQRRAANA